MRIEIKPTIKKIILPAIVGILSWPVSYSAFNSCPPCPVSTSKNMIACAPCPETLYPSPTSLAIIAISSFILIYLFLSVKKSLKQ